MTTLSKSQMQELDGEGFLDGLICGAAVGLAVALTVSPDPVSKAVVTAAWVAAVGTCGVAFT